MTLRESGPHAGDRRAYDRQRERDQHDVHHPAWQPKLPHRSTRPLSAGVIAGMVCGVSGLNLRAADLTREGLPASAGVRGGRRRIRAPPGPWTSRSRGKLSSGSIVTPCWESSHSSSRRSPSETPASVARVSVSVYARPLACAWSAIARRMRSCNADSCLPSSRAGNSLGWVVVHVRSLLDAGFAHLNTEPRSRLRSAALTTRGSAA